MSDSHPVEVVGLTKFYRVGFWMKKSVRALDGANFRIESGQVYGLLGPNGAGKSTTIKLLLDLIRPSSGTARLYGHPPSVRAARRMVGYLPENPAPYEYLTGWEFVHLAGALTGLSGQELHLRAKEVIGVVGLERASGLLVRRYSKGMVQRLALAQAIIHRPKLLILDEPTSGLDPVGRRQMRDLILEERQRGTTVLFCTHIIPDAEALCDRIAVLVGGRVVREGSSRQLLSESAPHVELAIEGLTLEAVHALSEAARSAQEIAGQVVVRGPDPEIQALARHVLEAGGRIARLQPVRFSMEDMFMAALDEVGGAHAVGSEIS